jgi:ribose transport system ATP-binding protein
VLAPLAREPIPPNAEAGRLPLAAQQLVVWPARYTARRASSSWTRLRPRSTFGDREAVFAAMRRLAAEGVLILFITHRMDEVMALSDEVQCAARRTVRGDHSHRRL